MKTQIYLFVAMLFAAFGFSSCTDDTTDLVAQINSLEQKLDSLSNDKGSKDLQAELEELRLQLNGKYSEKEINEMLNTYGIGGIEKGHFYIDLGLPSGTLWATCNVGANVPEEYGQYFAWGETKGYYKDEAHAFNEDKYFDKGYKIYNNDGGKTELDAEHDAASKNWGGKWRMPTKADFEELVNTDNCSWTRNEQKRGYYVRSKKNENSIFLPCAGSRNGEGLPDDGTFGSYWSRSLSEDDFNAYYLDCRFSLWGAYKFTRCIGMSVRPVCPRAE